MGHDSTYPETLDIYLNGEKVSGTIAEITFTDPDHAHIRSESEQDAALAQEFLRQFGPCEMTVTFKCKRLRCQNRKRFIKLMMGEGLSRNNARKWAAFVQHFMNSYQEVWTRYLINKICFKRKEDQNG